MSNDPKLLNALREAPRRYRLPQLTRGIAFAIEAARASKYEGRPLPEGAREMFLGGLRQLIREAMDPVDGDGPFQAAVLRASDSQVRDYVQWAAQEVQDRRTVRAAVDAIAHPGKLRSMAPGPERSALAQLHGWAQEEEWVALRGAAGGRLVPPAAEALDRLVRLSQARELPAVVRYRRLQGPEAGSDEAAAYGRNAARSGQDAERAVVAAFERIAAELGDCRVARSLLTPPGFPGEPGKAKDEWDVALLRGDEILLLAEVKSAPAAATSDFARLYRGLVRLAHADPHTSYSFPAAGSAVAIAGESLRRLKPHGRQLPPHVIYCTTAPVETEPAMLAAAARAVLLAEPASLAFARDETTDLSPVWDALTTEPRLRSALHQHETAVAVREAMLHPEDLLAALRP
jgi:hypothetical protein